MFLGIFLISLLFLWYLGVRRICTYFYLTQLTWHLFGFGEKPSRSFIPFYSSYLKYTGKDFFEKPATILLIPFFALAGVFIGFATFFDGYVIFDDKMKDELEKIFDVFSAPHPLLSRQTDKLLKVTFTGATQLLYQNHFSNKGFEELEKTFIPEVENFVKGMKSGDTK